ncbi:MAG: 50S ribosomal protein L21 [Blastochloris sp.]|nr:50S ribosomal protein L21 [Blastochloris sp.]
MFAIVTIAGQQFKVEEGQEIFVHRLEAEAGNSLSFNTVHLLSKGDDVTVGMPMLKATVGVTVLEHVKGDTVIVFKKKRRKGYRVKNGHRQQFTKLKLTPSRPSLPNTEITTKAIQSWLIRKG